MNDFGPLKDIMEEQRDLLRQIAEGVMIPREAMSPGKSSLENDFPELSKPVLVPLPSKMELAIKWLADHDADRELTGRELSETRRPEGVTISHKTWNDAKKKL